MYLDKAELEMLLTALMANVNLFAYLDEAVADSLETDGLFCLTSYQLTAKGRALIGQ